ncbi:ribonuclease domain-containing protein [Chryseobacterium sp. LAM-KRS1]|uniref:ribonuclease domain-containing protein n=1 Tax=Chryseobacterium sp. LAM-KRS1 TaxID=2715754 RepID=UPI0015541FE1|nr:ribonuclease domain-containing protein [Chryseobacterium sp. LAM-KRS1]
MNSKMRLVFFACIGLLFGMSVMYIFNKFSGTEKGIQNPKAEYSTTAGTANQQSIDQLTAEKTVISYVKEHHQLPDYYITKNEARKLGWNPSKGNLCDVLPGRAIGGDRFGNRERSLPQGNQYYEADVNYSCGSRNADRIIFTKEGDVYLTKNHYKSFEKQ